MPGAFARSGRMVRPVPARTGVVDTTGGGAEAAGWKLARREADLEPGAVPGG